VEPIPETLEVMRSFHRIVGADLESTLRELADLVVQLVPSCVGLSLSVPHADVTLTMVATTQRVAALDAVQYLHGGPCVDSAHGGAELGMEESLSEERWHEFAVAAATSGVRSSLSIPLVENGVAKGAVNVYAADPHAFDGRVEALRALLGRTAGIAVTDADLPFRTRDTAREAPATLRDRDLVDTAVGFVAATHRVGVDEARRMLHDAAERATVDPVTLARTLLQDGATSDDA
jgi:GAF domain-containing protein